MMIIYIITLMVRSRSQRGHGKLAWREWRAERSFANNELPRLPTVGTTVHIVLAMECVRAEDVFGGYGLSGNWDPKLPITKFRFELADATHQLAGVGGGPCYDEEYGPHSKLLERLTNAGFMVEISRPFYTQDPEETPPPAPAD